MALGVVLEINHHNGKPDLWCPKITCDECGRVIDDATMGNAHYIMDLGGGTSEVLFSCKHNSGACVRAIDYRLGRRRGENGGAMVAAVELDAFLVQIGANLGIQKPSEWKQARERAQVYAWS